MNLINTCKKIMSKDTVLLPPDHKLNTRLVCPEYSKSAQEVKTYPFLENDHVFALCWNIEPSHILSATMYPAPKPFCCKLDFTPGIRTQLHTHDYIELAYIVEGEFHQKILGKDIVFTKGDFCLIDKNCLHQDYLLDSFATVLFLGISNEMFSVIMQENITTQKIISFLQSALIRQKDVQQYLHFKPGASGSIEKMENCLSLLLEELYSNDIGSSYIRKGLLFRIFRLLSSEYEFSLSREQRKTMNWIIFEEVSDYIKLYYSNISIQDLVNEFHFQEDYFNRLIKSKTGMTYSTYLQQIRLEKACELLRNPLLTIDEICEAVGYHNKGFFYKIFKAKYGMTPSQYQKGQGKIQKGTP
ncbi:MAG: AraC family transcriptional regulator [Dorea sp.]